MTAVVLQSNEPAAIKQAWAQECSRVRLHSRPVIEFIATQIRSLAARGWWHKSPIWGYVEQAHSEFIGVLRGAKISAYRSTLIPRTGYLSSWGSSYVMEDSARMAEMASVFFEPFALVGSNYPQKVSWSLPGVAALGSSQMRGYRLNDDSYAVLLVGRNSAGDAPGQIGLLVSREKVRGLAYACLQGKKPPTTDDQFEEIRERFADVSRTSLEVRDMGGLSDATLLVTNPNVDWVGWRAPTIRSVRP